jgi:hypothetical protein
MPKIKTVDVDGSFEKVKQDESSRRRAEAEFQAKREELSKGVGGWCSVDGEHCDGSCRKANSKEGTCQCSFQCTRSQLFVKEGRESRD